MSRKNIASVIAAFRTHQAHREAACRTDGETVWSYEMVIAKRSTFGTVYIASRDLGPSRTTKAQIQALHLAFPPRKTEGGDGSVVLEIAGHFNVVPMWDLKENP